MGDNEETGTERKVWFPRSLTLEKLSQIKPGDIIEFSETKEDKEVVREVDLEHGRIKTLHGETVVHIYEAGSDGKLWYKDSEYLEIVQ